MSKTSKFKKIAFTISGVCAFSSVSLFCVIKTCEAKYSALSKGLPLCIPGTHLKQGTHRFVLTQSLYDVIEAGSNLDRLSAIDAIKNATDELSKLNECLNFELYSATDDFAKYGIQKVSDISDQDICVYAESKTNSSHKNSLAYTSISHNIFTYKIVNTSVTIISESLFDKWNASLNPFKHFNYTNYKLYSTLLHEGMHTMGFDHISHDSIMSKSASANIKTYTELDKYLIDKYNVQFYNSTPKYSETQAKQFEELLETK